MVSISTNRQAHRVRIPGPKFIDKIVSRFHHNRYVLAYNPITSLVCISCSIFSLHPYPPFQWVTILLAWDRRCANPIGDAVARLLTPWANQKTYHAAHTPRPGRTQNCDEIWRYFGLALYSYICKWMYVCIYTYAHVY